MRLTTLKIKDLLTPGAKLTFLAGAGCSIDPPSRLPAGMAMMEAIIKYTCPECKYEGEIQIPYKRKKIQGVDALVFNCQKCNAKIIITKKMKGI